MAVGLVTSGGVGPCVDGFDDARRDVELTVDVEDVRLGGGGLSDAQAGAAVSRQDDGADVMGLEGVAYGCPGGVDVLVEQGLLDGGQEMVGEQAEEDVAIDAMRGTMEDGALGEW